ncbi:MAG: hypothetical protein K6G31_14585 [Paludibacteraceae bacterium]|nr:hypothetical protein [Paludibacteraceae bacterium]
MIKYYNSIKLQNCGIKFRPLAFVQNVKKGQRVSIALGYDDDNRQEFDGFVKSVALDDNQLTLECEDPLYVFRRVDIPNGEKTNVTLKQLLDYVLGEVNAYIRSEGLGDPLKLNCLYDYGYSKITFTHATAYSVMEQIQKEGKPNIFISGGVLNIVPQYTHTNGTARYSMQRNICRDGLKLKWRNETDRDLYVEVKAKDTDGKTEIIATAGKARQNADKLEVKFNAIKDKASLQTIADNLYKSQVYTGYEGSFNGWLVPFCDAGYVVELTDAANELRSGRYYVEAVEVSFSSAGGVRSVSLGASVS